jgi:hypothetical protein
MSKLAESSSLSGFSLPAALDEFNLIGWSGEAILDRWSQLDEPARMRRLSPDKSIMKGRPLE